MREIKFRAWDLVTKTMQDVPAIFYASGEKLKMINMDENRRFEFMQSTGFKDLNGKEIYEGDIVVYQGGTYFEYKAIVQWINGGFAFMWEDKTYPSYLSVFWNEPMDSMVTEIIGNIWENPGLLKEEKSERGN